MAIVVPISRNHSRVAIHLAVINPASMTPITIICSLVMIKFANIMAEVTMNSSYLMMTVVIVMVISFRRGWGNKH